MRVGFAQFSPRRHDIQGNLRIVCDLLSDVDFDLVVLPELANSGYLYDDPSDLHALSERSDGSGPFLGALLQMAKEHNACVVTGFAEKADDELFNSAAALSSAGILQVYRKTHLFNTEKQLFSPGDTGLQVFEFKGVYVGMMICFDWIFPEAARTLSLKGGQIITHPANLVLPWCQSAMLTRSLENGVFCITANRVGEETGQGQSLRFTGGSQVTTPKGTRLISADSSETCVRVVEIDPELALNKSVGGGNDLLGDRRPDFYQI